MPAFTMKSVHRPEGGRDGRNGAEYDYGNGFSKPNAVPGEVVALIAPDDSEKWKFGFWSVRDSAQGNYIALTPSINVEVGTKDVMVKAWHVLRNPNPKNQSGVAIDAYDIDTGAFFDEAFVWVINADKTVDASLTAKANADGFVPTAKVKFIETKATVEAHVFGKWERVDGAAETISGGLVGLTQDSNSQMIAFFTQSRVRRWSPPLEPSRPVPVAGTWVSWGVMVDGGGPTGGGPVGPWVSLVMDIAAGVALAEAAGTVDRSLRKSLLKIASKQVSLSADRLQKAIEAVSR